MKYRCEKCNSAHESKTGAPLKCSCGHNVLIRTERALSNFGLVHDKQIFRSNGQHWVLDQTGKKFIPFK